MHIPKHAFNVSISQGLFPAPCHHQRIIMKHPQSWSCSPAAKHLHSFSPCIGLCLAVASGHVFWVRVQPAHITDPQQLCVALSRCGLGCVFVTQLAASTVQHHPRQTAELASHLSVVGAPTLRQLDPGHAIAVVRHQDDTMVERHTADD